MNKKKRFDGYRVKKFKGASHGMGGIKLDALGYTTNDLDKAAVEIEGNEVVSKDNNNQLYIYSDKLNAAEKANKASKFDGDDKLSRNTRKLILKDAKRFNEQELQKYIQEKLAHEQTANQPTEEVEGNTNNNTGSDEVPEALLGGLLTDTLLPVGLNFATDTLKTLIAGQDEQPKPIPMTNNTNPFSSTPQMKYGGKVPKYTLGTEGPDLPIDNTLLTTDNKLELGMPVIPANQFTPMIAVPQPDDNPAPSNLADGDKMQSMLNSIAPATKENKLDINLPAALRIGSGIGSALLSFQRPEEEQLQLADFSRGDALTAGTGVDAATLTNANQRAFSTVNEAARRASGTVGQYLNRLRANSGNLAQANDQALLRTKQYNDQVALQRAGRADRNAMSIAGERIRKQIADSQNQAMSQDQMQNFFNQMTNVATGLERKDALEKQMSSFNDAQKKQFLLNMAAIGLKNPNFGISANILKTLENAENMTPDELANAIIEFKSTKTN